MSQATNATTVVYMTGLEYDRPVAQIVFETVSLCAIWGFAIMGNVMVCVVIQRSKRLQSTTNYFVTSLAVTDILICMLCMPLVFVRVITNSWPFGSFVCKCLRSLMFALPASSVYVLLSIAADRFYTIIYPLNFKVTRSTAKRMIVASWLVAVPLSAFLNFAFVPYSHGLVFHCPTHVNVVAWWASAYVSFVALVIFYAPLTLVIVIYTRIFRYIWRFNQRTKTFQRTMNFVLRTKVKMVKMLMIVTSQTLVLYTPFFGLQAVTAVTGALYVQPTIVIVSMWLMFLTCFLKPALYLYHNSNFRRGCHEVLCRKSLKSNRGSMYAVTSASWRRNNRVGAIERRYSNRTDYRQPPVSILGVNNSYMTNHVSWKQNGENHSTYL